MEKMQELYEKISKDATLKEIFSSIIKDTETVGKDATKKKLIDFANDAGYDITLEEMQTFFKDLEKNNSGELSDIELDMVAGGKIDMTQHRDVLA